MTILEKVQAAEVGTIAIDYEPAKALGFTWERVVDEQCDESDELYSGWRSEADWISDEDMAATYESHRLYLIPPSALAQFEVTDDAS